MHIVGVQFGYDGKEMLPLITRALRSPFLKGFRVLGFGACLLEICDRAVLFPGLRSKKLS